ncbi:unnamed protein product [marine sediment metagenome]|uniref:Uncharacterized protein n=1 Tax=marine sediment metagenome TaxID=412755 RepID=X1DFV6_9ZZZZ
MKKTLFKSLFVIIFSLLLVFSSFNLVNASIFWEYEENLNDFKPSDCYEDYEGYNSIVLVNTKTINMISIYVWNNPSNVTFTERIRLGIYSNFNNEPEILLTQTEIININSIGWINSELLTEISLTSLVYYWIGWILINCSSIAWQYYRNVTNSLLFTQYQSDVGDNIDLFNPAEPEGSITNTRYCAFRLGFYSVDSETISTDFLDIFRNPENYFAGIVVISMTILLIYFILRRRK